jgi:hypothetical protein
VVLAFVSYEVSQRPVPDTVQAVLLAIVPELISVTVKAPEVKPEDWII